MSASLPRKQSIRSNLGSILRSSSKLRLEPATRIALLNKLVPYVHRCWEAGYAEGTKGVESIVRSNLP